MATAGSKTYDGTLSAPVSGGSALAPRITFGTIASVDTPSFTEAYSSVNAGPATLVPTGTITDGSNVYDYPPTTSHPVDPNYAVTILNATAPPRSRPWQSP